MRLLVCIVALAAMSACGMLDVKEQQAKIDAVCRIGGSVEAERKAAAPIIVVLARQIGADFEKRESWQIADHFVLEGPGPWQFERERGHLRRGGVPGSQPRPQAPARRALPAGRAGKPHYLQGG